MTRVFVISATILLSVTLIAAKELGKTTAENEIETKVESLLSRMTLEEKIGQMTQRNGAEGHEKAIQEGRIGSLLNVIHPKIVNKLQRIAVEESRLGIPLIIGRDVIHGFRTIFPIPLGLAATWNPALSQKTARIAATEAATVGINWTFAPMIDVTRDPRWGRIAEGFGEDPYLTSIMAGAMVRGFQGDDLSLKGSIAACAKHFAAYGAAEGGRDYNVAILPEQVLRDIYLPPFKAAVSAGTATLMVAFNEINGIPASGNELLLREILRKEWSFDGFVVSDWDSIYEMIVHGFAADSRDAAKKAVNAGVDMEMAGNVYEKNLKELVEHGMVPVAYIDNAVRNILRIKIRLGLFENPYVNPSKFPQMLNETSLGVAKKAAQQSIVLLKNANNVLPLSKEVNKIAVIGPMANAPYEQLGTWIFDGKEEDTRTPLAAIREFVGDNTEILFAPGLKYSRSDSTNGFKEAVNLAKQSDVVLLFCGEESILSGEAHCRASLDLPGAQNDLIEVLSQTGRPIVCVIMAGRPLTIAGILNKVQAILYAWHPGTMGGPAIADLIFGVESPSGKLPVTFPRSVGQIPIYYSHKNTGRPASKDTWVDIKKIPIRAAQTSLGNTSHYLDDGFAPLYPFGYGQSYTTFEYDNIKLSSHSIKRGQSFTVTLDLSNVGNFEAEEIVQLYICDLVGSLTRPVRELKGFQRVRLRPGDRQQVKFVLHSEDLAFHDNNMNLVTEPGKFHLWVGRDSQSGLKAEFEIL